MDTGNLKQDLLAIKEKAESFFSNASEQCEEGKDDEFDFMYSRTHETNEFWEKLDSKQHKISITLQKDLFKIISSMIPLIKNSVLLNEADERDIGVCAKKIRATLRLRKFNSWEAEVLHDEDIVLGVHPPGQSDNQPILPLEAKKIFDSCIEQLVGMLELFEATPANLPSGLLSMNPNISQSYRPNTAFIMMRIDPTIPESEDIYDVYKDCFDQFGIKAIRADDIEHEDVITDKIIEEIKASEFLLGDLTYERPSVYYEIGYAHSLGRRVIMYKRKGTHIHFDLAAYNCPEYSNMRELRTLLLKRLENTTNRKPQNS